MTDITIFGKGNMGTAIASLLASGSNRIDHITTSDSGKPVTGDLVVLAVPYPALAQISGDYAEQLKDKVVVDITNPVNFETFDSLVVPSDRSATAELATALPDSSVLKAFNTNFAATLQTKSAGSHRTTVLVAGDDDAAKAMVVGLVTDGGADAVDVGALSRARELEAIGFLQLTLGFAGTVPWTGGFSLAR